MRNNFVRLHSAPVGTSQRPTCSRGLLRESHKVDEKIESRVGWWAFTCRHTESLPHEPDAPLLASSSSLCRRAVEPSLTPFLRPDRQFGSWSRTTPLWSNLSWCSYSVRVNIRLMLPERWSFGGHFSTWHARARSSLSAVCRHWFDCVCTAKGVIKVLSRRDTFFKSVSTGQWLAAWPRPPLDVNDVTILIAKS